MYRVGIAYLLWLVSGFGALGFHRFYLGKIPTGILWMCTGGLGMIGAIYDFFTLPKQVDEANIRNAVIEQLNLRRGRSPYGGELRVVKEEEPVERIILKVAKQNKGIVTPTEVALESHISIDEAKKTLDEMVSKGIAELRVRSSGTLVYTLPELMDTDAPLESF